MTNRLPVFDPSLTRAVCDCLAQTGWPGLPTSVIEGLLATVRVQSLEPGPNKRERLFYTLHNVQVRQKAGNVLVAFINRAMSPVRYVSSHDQFTALQGELNAALVLYGLRVTDRGEVANTTAATNLDDAARLAGQLVTELRRRDTHKVVLACCDEEIIRKSLFHGTSEATKSVPSRIREMTGLAGDGVALYDPALGSKQNEPILRINEFQSESDVSEHKGFKNLLLGVHGHYRNPRAHSLRIDREEDRRDFLDTVGLVSYLHRRLDRATINR